MNGDSHQCGYTDTSCVPLFGVFMAEAEEIALNTDVNAEILKWLS